jgi:signal transduction histidine kinase/CheY-like chemotaxis protein
MLYKNKILVLDDSKTYLMYVKGVLKKNLPVRVITSSDPNEAIELLKSGNIDFLISDIEMPHLNGYEVLEILKQSEITKNIPVIFITGMSSNITDIKKGYNLGIVDFLQKPLNEEILVAKVKSYFQALDHVQKTATDKQVEKNYKKIQNILDSQTNFVIITDGYYLKDANKPLLKFFGYEDLKSFTMKHECICEFFIPKDGYLTKIYNGENWFNTILKNPKSEYKVIIKDKKGIEQIFSVSTNGILMEDNSYVVTFTNITELVTLQNSLQSKVEEQTKQITQQAKDFEKQTMQLLEQKKMASLGEMIGNIAHQWRQPLSAISADTSTVLLKQKMGTLQDHFLEEQLESINESVQYLSETIDTFRDFLTDKKVLKSGVIQEIIKRSIDISSSNLENNHIKMIDTLDYETPIEIETIASELQQVILNIVNNAKDILIEKKVDEPWVQIALKKSDDKVVVTIEDNGGGVPEEIISNIFEPYFTTKHKSAGTGLGLHMSYKIITESLGGKICVENTQNGAKFIIELPIS